MSDKHFYVESWSSLYGCIRCGEIGGDISQNTHGHYVCGSCGETSIVGFVQALDLLNDLYLKGVIGIPEIDEDDIEEFLSAQENYDEEA